MRFMRFNSARLSSTIRTPVCIDVVTDWLSSRSCFFAAARALHCSQQRLPWRRYIFYNPSWPGGGTAPGIGEALIKSGLVTDIAYENLSVGGGGRAIAKLIETAERQPYSSTQRP